MEARITSPATMLRPAGDLHPWLRLQRWVTAGLIIGGTDILCRLDASELERVPAQGPLILYTNHTGSLEVPLLMARLRKRPITGLAKIETWNNPAMAWLFTLWGAIPVRRGEADMLAMRQSLEALEKGWIVTVAPEGTRSRDGRLRRAHPGLVSLALRSGAPLMPLAHWGGEHLDANLKRLKRTDFHIRVGEPFRLKIGEEQVTREKRQALADEAMHRLARLMPEPYRGCYA